MQQMLLVTASSPPDRIDLPNLTQPYYEISAGYTNSMGTHAVAFAPVVKAEEE
jgi:hypothetical protein